MDRDALLLRYREGPDALEAATRGLSDVELDYRLLRSAAPGRHRRRSSTT